MIFRGAARQGVLAQDTQSCAAQQAVAAQAVAVPGPQCPAEWQAGPRKRAGGQLLCDVTSSSGPPSVILHRY